ncbi:hypothetical protein [Labrenzia sp. PHM005]|uniref:hypothetical protein n=1 Tax=Labrenzia sp. PHM005 TaxID=2590016 RepID=UPI001140379D|nr:hypothetical protein [Labrenzia sp. PHM005]QDG76531.1 hypothetical protein FJ695_11975 [Labrenzia sp. PHM005]
MTHSKQKRWLTDLLEGLPSIVFILLWRQSGDIETAGWLGSGVALGVLAVLVYLKAKMHPVFIGINLHILLATPIIVGLFRTGQTEIAEVLSANTHSGVLVTVLIVGIGQTLFSARRFSALEDVSDTVQLRYSLVFLGACALGAGWALTTTGSSFVPVVATLTVLFVGRNFLQARLSDKNGSGAAAVTGSAVGSGKGSSVDPAT